MNPDAGIFCFVNKTLANPVFDFLMPIITTLGSGEFVFVIAIILLLYGLKKKDKIMAGILVLAGLAPVYYLVSYLKGCVARPRPFMALSGVHCLGKAEDFAFPSGHAAIAFMAAFILSKYFKNGRVIFYSIAVLVCISRIYVGAHYVTDVAAGAALGMMVGYMLVKVAERLL